MTNGICGCCAIARPCFFPIPPLLASGIPGPFWMPLLTAFVNDGELGSCREVARSKWRVHDPESLPPRRSESRCSLIPLAHTLELLLARDMYVFAAGLVRDILLPFSKYFRHPVRVLSSCAGALITPCTPIPLSALDALHSEDIVLR